MEKLRQFLNRSDSCDEDVNIISQINDATTLSWSTRIKGFCIFFLFGLLFSTLSWFSLLLHKSAIHFAIFYTFGNLMSMSSTFFLMGPKNQLKKMFSSTRYIAAILVIASMIFTLIAALKFHKIGLTLLSIIFQWCCLAWYSISYIPYARDAVKKVVSNFIV